ncbi:unnamed protein product [Somion occarium]|uniref:DNA polymerase eta n=1 Tax=Somion occarium TaxID=3059160 RepID=A0ABP1E9Z8_9APHY
MDTEGSVSSSIWKGKAKATDLDYEDINSPITYRHLLSNNLGVRDPLRVVALCDSDAFYAACEQVRLGVDPSVPLVVLQWQALIAVNYPARRYGISRMDNINDAKKRCPDLKVVHVATYREGEKEPGYWPDPDTMTHKVSLDLYRRESAKIIQLFKDGLPGGEIERASIDEAFIEFTRPVREEILKRYPYLSQIPANAPLGRDTPLPPPPPINWDGLGVLIPVHPPPSADVSKPISEETPPGQPVEEERTWHDVALSIAADLMGKIRRDIHEKLGYTTSAGIARNKFLAKLTASYKKPNSQSILRNAAIPNYLRPMPFQKIRFLGGKLGKALAEEYDVSTVGDLLTITLEEMQRKFGENSIWVYELLRGIDRSEVKEKPPVTKSHHWIRVLAAELALRLKEGREAIPALWPKTIVLHARQGYEQSRSKQAPFPFTREPSVDVIAAAGDKLWKELVGTDESRATPMKISSVQLSFTGIDSMETGQRNIEGFFKPRSSDDRLVQAVKRKRNSSAGASRPISIARTADGQASKIESSRFNSFMCERCGRRVALTDELHSLDDDIKQEALASLRVEHDDFHFAQDLAKESHSDSPKRAIRPQSSTSSTAKPPPKKKRKSQEKGIARFFDKS